MASDGMSNSVIFLTIFVVLNTIAVVIVTLVQCNNIRDLETSDLDLEMAIDDLFADSDYTSKEKLRRSVRGILTQPDHKKRSGIQDIFMDLLKTQEKVIEQNCNDKTKVCKQGDIGDQGPPGDKGPRGSQGPPGIKGLQGVQGQQGPKGVRGLAGDPGSRGAAGKSGAAGPKGADGDAGISGTKGSIGPKGEPGTAGIRGEKGARGVTGIPGGAGQRGPRGPKGTKGINGLAGVKGQKGEPGQRGADRDKLKVGCECLKKPTIGGPETEIRHSALGSDLHLQCFADGVPPPSITWTGYPNVKSPVLDIPTVTSFDYSTYQCTASNVFGSDTKNFTVMQ